MENTERTLALILRVVFEATMSTDLWIPVTNEELACRREPGNVHDPCAVAVTKTYVTKKRQKMSACFLCVY